MPKKSFSIYNAGEDFEVKNNDRLVIELGKLHLACILTAEDKKSVTGFELFDFTEPEAGKPDNLYNSIAGDSKILGRLSGKTHVYINHELCVPVPIYKFNKEIAEDYLNTVFGECPSSNTQFEHLAIEPGIMNVFRVCKNQVALLQNVSNVTFHHTYSNVIKRHTIFADSLPLEFIAVQFYNTYIVVIVMKEGKLNLIQSFIYENAEDVLYHLLNICERYQLYSSTLNLQISGMIDLEFRLYRELIKYFKQVSVGNLDSSIVLPSANEYPLHYFTPFFNLAL